MAEYYCDMDIGTATGSGTSGDPWGTIDYALASITRSATPTTDYLHVKGSSTRSTPVTFPTSGGTGQLLIISGYDSVAWDLSGWSAKNPNAIALPSIEFGGANLQTGNEAGIFLHNLKLTGLDSGFMDANHTSVIGCWMECAQHANRTQVHNSKFVVTGPFGVRCSAVTDSVITASGNYAIYVNGGFKRVERNLIVQTSGKGAIIVVNINTPQSSKVSHNSIYTSEYGVVCSRGQLELVYGNVIHRTVSGPAISVENDLGYAPAYGFQGNAIFGCSTLYSANNTPLNNRDNVTLSNAPYSDPLNDDWAISSELKAITGSDGLTPGAIQGAVGSALHPLYATGGK